MNVSPQAIRGVEAEIERLQSDNQRMRKAIFRTLNLKRRVDDLDPVDVCYVITEHQIRMLEQSLLPAFPKAAAATDKQEA